MKRIIAAIFTAVTLGAGLSAAAQSGTGAYEKPGLRATPNGRRGQVITVTGCVQRTKAGGYFLTHARVEEGQSQKSTMGSAYNATNVWSLQQGRRLENYLGEKVRVTGTPDWPRVTRGVLAAQPPGSKPLKAHQFDVKTMTAIASSCE